VKNIDIVFGKHQKKKEHGEKHLKEMISFL